jgi:hypothetical protein
VKVETVDYPDDPYEVLHIDAADGDWIKRGTWDIPAANIEELREHLERIDMPTETFKRLDVYKENLARLPWLADL